MAQYKSGRVLAKNGSAVIYAGVGVDWTSITAGSWFAVKDSFVTYNVLSRTLNTTSSFSAWSSSVTYAFGTAVSFSGGMWIAIASTNLNHTPATGSAWWLQLSGWSLTLSSVWAGSSSYNLVYGIVKDFTPIYGLPLPAPGDIEMPAILSRAMSLLDDVVSSNAASAATISVVSQDADSATLSIDDGIITSEDSTSVTLTIA